MLTLKLVVREGDLKRKPQGFRGYKTGATRSDRVVTYSQTRIDQKESHKASEDIKTGSTRSDRVVTCSQMRRDLKRKPQGFLRGYKNWIHQIRPSRDL